MLLAGHSPAGSYSYISMSFWSERTLFRLPSCVAQKMRCLKLRTVRLALRQLMAFQLVCVSVPFAKECSRN